MSNVVLSLCRILLGCVFLIFGISKIFSPEAYAGQSFVEFFPQFIQQKLQGHPFPYWDVVLTKIVLPRADLFAWSVALGELLIGLSLVSGFLVRWSSLMGILLMISIQLCENPFASPGPFWMHVSKVLETFSIVMLLGIFLFFGAGRTLGFDGIRKKAKEAKKELRKLEKVK